MPEQDNAKYVVFEDTRNADPAENEVIVVFSRRLDHVQVANALKEQPMPDSAGVECWLKPVSAGMTNPSGTCLDYVETGTLRELGIQRPSFNRRMKDEYLLERMQRGG